MSIRNTLHNEIRGRIENAASERFIEWLSVRDGNSLPNQWRVDRAILDAIDAYLAETVGATGWEKTPDGKIRFGKKGVQAFREAVAALAAQYRKLIETPTVGGMQTVRREFRNLSARFENLLSMVLDTESIGSKDEDYYQIGLREGAWPATSYSTHELFPEAYDYQTETHVPAPWKLAQTGAKGLRKWQDAWRKALAAFDLYLDRKGVLTLDTFRDQLDVDGVAVLSYGKDRDEKAMSKVVTMIRQGTAAIRGAGLESALRGLVVNVRFTAHRNESAAATYDPGTGEVDLLPWAITEDHPGSFVHEVGHRFYYRFMSEKARDAWEAKLNERQSYVMPDDVDAARPYIEAFYRDVQADPAFYERFRVADSAQRMGVAAQWTDRVPDLSPIERARLRFIVRIAARDRGENVEKGLESARFWASEHKHRGVGIEPTAEPDKTSDYGSFNPSEAFAESFRLYVTKGPRVLGDWTRQFFRDVVRSGGAARLRYNTGEA